MNAELKNLFAEFDRYPNRIPLAALSAGLKRLDHLEFEELEPFCQFAPDRYRRNLIHAGPGYHALLLCWRAGQSSPIHDHRGSACAVRVLRGAAEETVYQMAEEGHVFPVRTRLMPKGCICVTEDRDIHRLSNFQATGEDLVTLHLYSPPLLVMGQYATDRPFAIDFNDEVHAFAAGAGI